MRHHTPYEVALTVWVPLGECSEWHPCPTLADALGQELITGCADLHAVLRAQGRLVGRLLDAPGVPYYHGYRIDARSSINGGLVGMYTAMRSTETGAFVEARADAELFRACDWVHECPGSPAVKAA